MNSFLILFFITFNCFAGDLVLNKEILTVPLPDVDNSIFDKILDENDEVLIVKYLYNKISDLNSTISTLQEKVDLLEGKLSLNSTKISTIISSVSSLDEKTQYFSLDESSDYPTMQFKGVNIQILNNQGECKNSKGCTTDGTGNIIFGYNSDSSSPSWTSNKAGSYNLIWGYANNYSGFGNIIQGTGIDASGNFNSIIASASVNIDEDSYSNSVLGSSSLEIINSNHITLSSALGTEVIDSLYSSFIADNSGEYDNVSSSGTLGAQSSLMYFSDSSILISGSRNTIDHDDSAIIVGGESQSISSDKEIIYSSEN